MFVLMPEVGLGEEAREGKEGRKEREQEGGVPKIYQQQEGHTTIICAI